MNQRINVYLIAFVTGFAMMSFEMLGIRVLTPYFGSSVYVLGAIIAVVLAGLALGYALGGRLADRDGGSRTLPVWLALAALALLVFPLYGHGVARTVYRLELEAREGALLLSLLLFLAPCVFVGMATPLLVKMRAAATGKVGSAAGDVYAVSTAGSIAGTLITTFFLITTIGVVAGILLNGALLATTSLLALLPSRSRAGGIQRG